MPSLALYNLDSNALQQILENPLDFERECDARIGDVGELLRDVAVQLQDLLAAKKCDARWLGYAAVDTETRQVVGTCAFKGEPVNGSVEIAYYTFPPFEHTGCGTAMAAELIRIAEGQPGINTVLAHTLPERNPSTRILEKNGFRFLRELVDPEDGLVWRWERKIARSG